MFCLIEISLYFCNSKKRWSVRLGVRTPGFHPGNRGSIPLRTTNNIMNCKLIVDLQN